MIRTVTLQSTDLIFIPVDLPVPGNNHNDDLSSCSNSDGSRTLKVTFEEEKGQRAEAIDKPNNNNSNNPSLNGKQVNYGE
jgi:hypothetical protein